MINTKATIKPITVSSKYQIVIPKAARDKYGIRANKRLNLVMDEEGIHILPEPEHWVEYMKGLGKSVWKEEQGVKGIDTLRDEWS